ncbi:zinc ABC transporter substrate-binding protein AztC [Microbacterium sp. QXD-8]|uniref:Zinc ABC transporter substrate-binding protein AztC n=1 Tax=Microbacterium psychrotolerans TaxID=3068321 RepID=A0ABU0Z4M9_9MICO|nr:zinc ABC transporter substrate-binding protein AztC [Microbacterium sp. QXD-8]MDQ7878476.1 zinc ABC transporter substrate-binding protein AztC [Microbacterium sp. QXD-8]
MISRRHAALAALLTAVATASVLSACTPAAADRPLVVVSTNILGDVVDQLVGDDVEVMTLMRPDADPHSFEISAQDAARLRTADLLVSNGLGLEEGLQQHLDAAVAEGVDSFVAGESIDVLEYATGDAAGTLDPHFWTDPARMIDVVEELAPRLSDLPGVDEADVDAHVDAYLAELRRLDDDMAAAFETIPAQRRALVTNHHVFGYLAERFGFRIVGAAIPGSTTLAAPSASDLADLVSAIEENGVPAVFAESSSPDRLMHALAQETDTHVEVIELFPESLTAAGGGAEDYLTMMRENTQRIVTGLAP